MDADAGTGSDGDDGDPASGDRDVDAAPADAPGSDSTDAPAASDRPTPPTPDPDADRALPPAFGDGRLLPAVLVVTALSLAVRLVDLGGRIMHWDEGRVAYWALRYHESGRYSYRPIVHGPFLQLVNDYVFVVLPPSDVAVRLPVAVVGGLFPLVALLFRDRLRDGEVLALAALLAANPLLVYYSRFMRNDVLVAAFSVAALGFAVRAIDRHEVRALYPAAASLALAYTTKGNVVVYLLCFAGATALVLDHHLLRAVAGGRSVRTVLRRDWPAAALAGAERMAAGSGTRRTGRGGQATDGGALASPRERAVAAAGRLAPHAALVTATFLAVVTFFYAPRPALWQALGDPGRLPGVVETATVGSWQTFYGTWIGGTHQAHDYEPFLKGFLETLVYGAAVVTVLAALGVVADSYLGDGRRRDLVSFATYWGVVSVVGYPAATDIEAPWAAVHVVVPLAIPAAVGLAFLGRSIVESVETGDLVGAALGAVVVLAAVGGVVSANADYWNSTDEADKEVLQWAQPANDLQSTLADVRRVSATNEGTDVLFYGTESGGNALFYVENESSARQPPPGGPNWHSRLPLPWYLERYGATVNSTPPERSASDVAADAPPVVVAYAWDRQELAGELPETYVAHEHDFKLWGERVVVFVDESRLPDARA
jgi:uncharacterized protein (TIGR03663 family)